MDKVVFVKANFIPVGKYETIKIPTGEKKTGLFGSEKDVTREEKKWVQTGFSDKKIDGGLLQQDVQLAIEKLNKEGFEVISITPVTSGDYSWNYKESGANGNSGGYGYGYGFSYTEGILVVAKKLE